MNKFCFIKTEIIYDSTEYFPLPERSGEQIYSFPHVLVLHTYVV